MVGFGIRWGRVFTQVQDSEEYLLFLTNSNPNPNIFIVIPPSHGTGPAEPYLPVQLPPIPRRGVGCGSSTSENVDPFAVVVVVVSFVIVFVPVPVPEVDTRRCLWEAEGYPHVDHRPEILVVVIFYPRPPSALMMIFFPVALPPMLLGERNINKKMKRKEKRKRRARQGRHFPPQIPVRDSEHLPAVKGGIRG